MIKNDIWIKEQAENGMIDPFAAELVRNIPLDPDLPEVLGKCISFGQSSYGYDLRLSPNDFRVFRHIPGTVVNPKNPNAGNLESVRLHIDHYGKFFILPAHSYGLGVSLERVSMPPNVTALCLGKSTYARNGIIANITPIEAAWSGHITLEFSNSSSADCRIYANEGVVQLLFFEGEKCSVNYQDRAGKYQNQGHEVVLSKV